MKQVIVNLDGPLDTKSIDCEVQGLTPMEAIMVLMMAAQLVASATSKLVVEQLGFSVTAEGEFVERESEELNDLLAQAPTTTLH